MCIFIWPAIDAQGRARETREQAPAPLSRPNPLRGPTAKKVAGPEKNLGPLAPLSGPQATFQPLRGPSFCLARAKPAPSCPRLGTRPFGAPRCSLWSLISPLLPGGSVRGVFPPRPSLRPLVPRGVPKRVPPPRVPCVGVAPGPIVPAPGATLTTQGPRVRACVARPPWSCAPSWSCYPDPRASSPRLRAVPVTKITLRGPLAVPLSLCCLCSESR